MIGQRFLTGQGSPPQSHRTSGTSLLHRLKLGNVHLTLIHFLGYVLAYSGDGFWSLGLDTRFLVGVQRHERAPRCAR
jgi:hypothetical protein